MRELILRRLREPSTWAGIAALVTSAATAVATRDPNAIGATVAAAAAIVMPERKAP